jgi:CheY-like chemotaxis protein
MMAKVLVVEDDPDVRELVVMALEESGYEVLGAQHGREAIQMLLDPNGVGLLLLDMRMPVMDGWQFSAHLRSDPALRAQQHLPVIVLTAAADAAQWAADVGAASYIAKPFDLATLRRVVAAFVSPC